MLIQKYMAQKKKYQAKTHLTKGEKMEVYEVLDNKEYRNSLGLYRERKDADKVAANHMPDIQEIAKEAAESNTHNYNSVTERTSMINNAIVKYAHLVPVIETRVVH